ncbi:NUDIX hydrolase [Carboxylicivirga linearis]|uniref:Uncharacterized protein n=1 Tax=Carboxylicivirga linearis TaxID=1628157 RepID=A0ABS5K1J9_9BACT|nr:hypothetical protein [Carboxylicivirga linearis]
MGVILENTNNEILTYKRKGFHAPVFSIAKGHLKEGETFKEAVDNI